MAFERREQVFGKHIPVVSQNLGMDEAMACISEATGQVVKYEFLPDADARALPMASAPEIANLYLYFRETDHYKVSPLCHIKGVIKCQIHAHIAF